MCEQRKRSISVFISVLFLINQFDIGNGNRCIRVPSERMQIHHTPSNGNFVLRFSDPGELYKPGEQYTGERRRSACAFAVANLLFALIVYLESASYQSPYHRKTTTFTGFYLSVEVKGEGPVSADTTQVFDRIVSHERNSSTFPIFGARNLTRPNMECSSWRRVTRWPKSNAAIW